MISFVKRGAIILLAFFAFGTIITRAQIGTKILAIDSIAQLEPIIMFDSTDFYVVVSVNDTSVANADSIFGDLFFYYLTDSMDSASVPARVINNDTNDIWIIGSYAEIISIDIRPDEIKTTPVNLIILWPAMIDPGISDTDSVYFQVGFDGYMGLSPLPDKEKLNVIFPCPAIQFIYIRPEEINEIRQIRILSMNGTVINKYEATELSNGFINIDQLSAGNYIVEVNYYKKDMVRTTIMKN